MKWSNNQLEAINALGKNVVVSASAGAGKTAVLTERLAKRIIKDKVSVSNILAMTFTEAAAAEMKKRLYNRISQEIENTSDEELKDYCKEQLILLSSASVSTIHSFCLSVIKENYYTIGLDPNSANNILGEEDLIVLKDKAFENAVNEFCRNNFEEYVHLSQYFSGRSDDFSTLKETVLTVASVAYNSSDESLFYDTIIDKYKRIESFKDFDNEIKALFFNSLISKIDNSLGTLKRLLLEYDVNNDPMPALLSVLQNKANLLETASELLKNHEYSAAVSEIETAHSIKSPRFTSKFSDLGEIFKDPLKSVNNSLKSLLGNCYSEGEFVSINNDLTYIVSNIVQLSADFNRYFTVLKSARGAIDFADMEKFALNILKADNGRIAGKYQKMYTDILVDEFQDTNEIQDEIIKSISRGNNVFRVGDVKQSIYKFRGAKPKIMAELIKNENDQNHVIYLNENYRSKKSIVEFNNNLFNLIMNINSTYQSYSKNDFVSIGTEAQDDKNELLVEFDFISTDKKDDFDHEGDTYANYLVEKITEMINTTQFSKWSDYCILLRRHSDKEKIRYVFENANIPYSMGVTTGFYNSDSVLEIVQFFKLLNDTSDNLAFTSVLTSYWFNESIEDVTSIMIRAENRSLFEAYSEFKPDITEKINSIIKIMNENGLREALNEILALSDYYEEYCDIQQKTNIDSLMDKVHDYEGKYGSSLNRFLDYIEAASALKDSEARSASADDVVNITTIHQSKGLQYPVVLFWSNSKTSIPDNIKKVLIDENLGLGLRHIEFPYRFERNSMQRIAIEYKNTIDELEENIRLLYVALTRAQSKLISFDVLNSIDSHIFEEIDLSLLLAKKGFTSLILSGSSKFSQHHKLNHIDGNRIKTSLHEKRENIYVPINKYSFDTKQITSVAPSSTENVYIGNLNLSGQSTTQRGTDLHELVEYLGDLPWNKDMIYSLNPDTTEGDIHRLLALSTNQEFVKLNSYPHENEFSFFIKLDDSIIHGFIDFIAFKPSEVVIIDFKSDRGVTENVLIERYKSQLDSYALAISTMYPEKKISTYIYSFHLNSMIKISE